MKEIILGIDLGTTNSEVAVLQDGKVIVIGDVNHNKIIPSVVGVSINGELLVGAEAKNQYVIYPEMTAISIKRKMGSSELVKLGDNTYTPQEISAMILKKLKVIAENYLGVSVFKAVITVPAYFSDAQRQATKEAGEIAGLEVVRIINEPTAAALAYEADNQEHKKILIYDLGGGTFDVSVVSLEADVVEVLSSCGNNHLGGDDFDEKIISYVCDKIKEDGLDPSSSSQALARIKRAAENAKIVLSDNPFALIEEEYLLEHDGKPYHLSLEISREKYIAMIDAYIDETLNSVHQAIEEANLMASDINEVLLVGGSTRTPIISTRLAEVFGYSPRGEVDPELCVALGAAIQGATIAGEKCSAVLVDITPYTFGTSCLGVLKSDMMEYEYVYQPLIQKNSPIPTSKSEVFFTMHENQDKVLVDVYQGEHEDALRNIKIGEFTVMGLRKGVEHNQILITFKLNVNGVLQVTAREKATGLEQKIEINNVMSQLSSADIDSAKNRIDLLFGGTDVIINDLGEPAKDRVNHAVEQLINKARAKMEKVSNADDKEDLVNLIELVTDSLSSNDYKQLDEHVEQLTDILHYMDA